MSNEHTELLMADPQHLVSSESPEVTCKANAEKVREIRRFLGKHSRAEIAEMHDVHERTIDKIAVFETWYQVE